MQLSAETLQAEMTFAGPTYIVFWWRNIPLGDAFFTVKTPASGLPLYHKIIQTIEPSIAFYVGGNRTSSHNRWKDYLLKNDYTAFESFLSTLLEQYITPLPGHLPVSVIVCTRNRSLSLSACLTSLSQMESAPMEIIVVDNAPKDEQTFLTTSEFAGVIYVVEPSKGLDIARNTGIRNSKFSIVAFIDDDVLVHPCWLQNVWSTFSEKSISAMTGLVLAHSLETEAQWLFEKHWKFNRGYIEKSFTPSFINDTLAIGPPVWEIGAGANMAFRKTAFERAGNFDERLDAGAAGCNGDSELWCRVLAKGMNIQYNPRAVVFHKHRRDLAIFRKQLYNYMRGFTAACLFQLRYLPNAGYRRHLLKVLPKYYIMEVQKGFPNYTNKHRTLWFEIAGVVSGWFFYLRNKKKPTNQN